MEEVCVNQLDKVKRWLQDCNNNFSCIDFDTDNLDSNTFLVARKKTCNQEEIHNENEDSSIDSEEFISISQRDGENFCEINQVKQRQVKKFHKLGRRVYEGAVDLTSKEALRRRARIPPTFITSKKRKLSKPLKELTRFINGIVGSSHFKPLKSSGNKVRSSEESINKEHYLTPQSSPSISDTLPEINGTVKHNFDNRRRLKRLKKDDDIDYKSKSKTSKGSKMKNRMITRSMCSALRNGDSSDLINNSANNREVENNINILSEVCSLKTSKDNIMLEDLHVNTIENCNGSTLEEYQNMINTSYQNEKDNTLGKDKGRSKREKGNNNTPKREKMLVSKKNNKKWKNDTLQNGTITCIENKTACKDTNLENVCKNNLNRKLKLSLKKNDKDLKKHLDREENTEVAEEQYAISLQNINKENATKILKNHEKKTCDRMKATEYNEKHDIEKKSMEIKMNNAPEEEKHIKSQCSTRINNASENLDSLLNNKKDSDVSGFLPNNNVDSRAEDRGINPRKAHDADGINQPVEKRKLLPTQSIYNFSINSEEEHEKPKITIKNANKKINTSSCFVPQKFKRYSAQRKSKICPNSTRCKKFNSTKWKNKKIMKNKGLCESPGWSLIKEKFLELNVCNEKTYINEKGTEKKTTKETKLQYQEKENQYINRIIKIQTKTINKPNISESSNHIITKLRNDTFTRNLPGPNANNLLKTKTFKNLKAPSKSTENQNVTNKNPYEKNEGEINLSKEIETNFEERINENEKHILEKDLNMQSKTYTENVIEAVQKQTGKSEDGTKNQMLESSTENQHETHVISYRDHNKIKEIEVQFQGNGVVSNNKSTVSQDKGIDDFTSSRIEKNHFNNSLEVTCEDVSRDLRVPSEIIQTENDLLKKDSICSQETVLLYSKKANMMPNILICNRKPVSTNNQEPYLLLNNNVTEINCEDNHTCNNTNNENQCKTEIMNTSKKCLTPSSSLMTYYSHYKKEKQIYGISSPKDSELNCRPVNQPPSSDIDIFEDDMEATDLFSGSVNKVKETISSRTFESVRAQIPNSQDISEENMKITENYSGSVNERRETISTCKYENGKAKNTCDKGTQVCLPELLSTKNSCIKFTQTSSGNSSKSEHTIEPKLKEKTDFFINTSAYSPDIFASSKSPSIIENSQPEVEIFQIFKGNTNKNEKVQHLQPEEHVMSRKSDSIIPDSKGEESSIFSKPRYLKSSKVPYILRGKVTDYIRDHSLDTKGYCLH